MITREQATAFIDLINDMAGDGEILLPHITEQAAKLMRRDELNQQLYHLFRASVHALELEGHR